MKRQIVIVLVLALSSMGSTPPARAAEYESSFGFGISVPDVWLVLTRSEVTENAGVFLDADANSGLDAVPLTMRQIVYDRVMAGELEIFYRREEASAGFVDNVNVLMQPSGLPVTQEQVAGLCRILPTEFSRVFGRPIAMDACEMRNRSGRRMLYLQFDGAIPGTTTMQYQIERGREATLVMTATSTTENLPRMLGEFEGMVASIRMY